MDAETHNKIITAIKSQWQYSGLTIARVAEMLGTTPAAVSNILARPISKKTADKFAELFGFNKAFMLTGEGSLTATESGNDEVINALRETIRTQQETIRLLSNLLKEKGAYAYPELEQERNTAHRIE